MGDEKNLQGRLGELWKGYLRKGGEKRETIRGGDAQSSWTEHAALKEVSFIGTRIGPSSSARKKRGGGNKSKGGWTGGGWPSM